MSRSLKTVKSNPLAGKVKKLMQTDEDVGKIAQGAPLLLGDWLSVTLDFTLAIEVALLVQLGRWSCFWGNCVKAQQQWPPIAMHGQQPLAICRLLKPLFG